MSKLHIFKLFQAKFFKLNQAPGSPNLGPAFLTTLYSNLSGLLINHNAAWGYPLPKPDNFVHILGMALQDEFPPLPKVSKEGYWKFENEGHTHIQSGASYLSQDFVMFFHVSCEGLPGQ